MSQKQSINTYTTKERNMYLIGLVGQNIIYGVSTVFSYYFQFTLLIPAMAVSIILTMNQIWDAIKDPIMGVIMDKTQTKLGKARPFVLFSPIPAGVLLIMCFCNGIYKTTFCVSNIFIVLWAALSCFLFGLAFSAGDIPINSLPNLMTENEQDRTKLISLKTIGVVVAGLSVAVQPLALQVGNLFHDMGMELQKSERAGFLTIAILFSACGTIMFQLAGFFVKERIVVNRKASSIGENFKLMWKNTPFRAVLISGILASPKAVEMVGSLPLYTYYYANKEPMLIIVYAVLLGFGSFAGKLIASHITPKLVIRHEKRILFIVCNLICAAIMLLIYLLYLSAPTQMATPVYLFITALLYTVGGTASGIQSIIINLFIADAVDMEEYESGIRPDGVFTSGQTVTVKISSGISSLIGGILYAVVGLSSERIAQMNTFVEMGGVLRTTTDFSGEMNIFFFLSTIPSVIGAILCILPVIKYPLSDKEHTRMLDEINKRRYEP